MRSNVSVFVWVLDELRKIQADGPCCCRVQGERGNLGTAQESTSTPRQSGSRRMLQHLGSKVIVLNEGCGNLLLVCYKTLLLSSDFTVIVFPESEI